MPHAMIDEQLFSALDIYTSTHTGTHARQGLPRRATRTAIQRAQHDLARQAAIIRGRA